MPAVPTPVPSPLLLQVATEGGHLGYELVVAASPLVVHFLDQSSSQVWELGLWAAG